MTKKSKKTMVDLMMETRTIWNINPRTRVQEDETKNKKKRRQQEKKRIKEQVGDDNQPAYFFCRDGSAVLSRRDSSALFIIKKLCVRNSMPHEPNILGTLQNY